MKYTADQKIQACCQQSATQADARVTKERALLLLLISLFLGEISILVMVIAMNMNGHRSMTMFLSSQPGKAFLAAAGILGLAAVGIIHQYHADDRANSKTFYLTLGMNLFMILLLVLSGEMVVRLGVINSRGGEAWRWGEKVLVPLSWEQIASSHKKYLTQSAGRLSYLVYDDLMGWTIGPNRRNVSGLYYSSWEGIRAPREGVSYVKSTEKTRIALVGDSYTFAEDVPFEDSWGYHLEEALGSEFEVLNFGVGGYGIDQAFLRYEKEVRQWNPQVVILGFPSTNVERTMVLYPPLTSGWWEFPFSKPRFILRNESLQTLNVPPITPQDLFSRRSIAEVPFLEYDRKHRPSRWQASVMHRSYLVRAIMTLFPPGEVDHPEVSDTALISVNGAILQTFVQSVRSAGSIPIVMFFPETTEEFAGQIQMGLKVLHESGIDYTDLTPCMRTIPSAERYVPKHSHYSVQSNARVAECLVPVVRKALTSSLPAPHHRSSQK